MGLTYNQIIKLLRDFTDSHFILKSFGNGEPWELVESSTVSDINYPMMWVQDQPNTIQQGEEIYNFRIYFLNQVATLKEKTDTTLNETNVNEVKSDMRQCATDLISYFAQDTNYPDLNINRTVNLTSFTEDFNDTLTGWYIDLRFNQAFKFSSCNLPIDGIPAPPSVTCEDGVITINGIDFSSVVSGGIENIVVKDTDGLEVGSKVGSEWIVPIGGGESILNANGDYITNINSGDTYDLQILDSNDNPTGEWDSGENIFYIGDASVANSTLSYLIYVNPNDSVILPDITHTDSDLSPVTLPAQIPMVCTPATPPITDIAYVRDHWTINEGTSNLNGDLKWYIDNTDVFTTYNVNGIAPILDPSDTSKLLTINKFGNLNRRTNDKGNQNYTDVGGGLTSDGATANYGIDNFTGKGMILSSIHSGTQNWNDSVVTAQATTLTAYDGSVYGSDDYGQFTMLTRKSVNHICVGDSLTTIFDGIQNWSDNFHWIMSSGTPTSVYFWRQNQNTESGTRFNSFSNTSVNAGIDLIVERNHF